MKIHLQDNVLVTVGKYRGKTGAVVRLLKKTERIVVEKVNLRVRHIKKTPGKPGQKITFEAPFPAANVMVICPNCSKTTRVSYVKLKTGKKQRVCKKCSQSLDKPVQHKKTKKH